MSLDVNKILMETLESSEAENQTDPKKVDSEGNPIAENTETQTDPNAATDPNAVVNEDAGTDSEGLPVGIYASAISAGLGAISLRNRLRSVYEMSDEAKRKLKKAGKIAGAAGALGGAAYGAHKLAQGEVEGGTGKTSDTALDKIKDTAESATEKAKNWVTSRGAKNAPTSTSVGGV